MSTPVLHRPPRRPWGWLLALVLSQALVAALWWRFGWRLGLPCLLASHLPFVWGTLWPRSRLFGPVLARLPLAADDRRVWLTIDDGPSPETRALLDLLDAHGAKATFFLVGDRAARRPGDVREIVRRGHGIGNHSASHPQAWFWALGPRRMAREIARTQAVLCDLAGRPPRWFRAVVGMANPFLAAPLRRHGLARVAWSARGFDGVGRAPEQVVARIARALAPGAIVLLHEGGAATRSVRTLRLLLEHMRATGWRTVLPEELPAGAAARARVPVQDTGRPERG